MDISAEVANCCSASLWEEKHGEVEPEGLSGNLVVQLGSATEGLTASFTAINGREVLYASFFGSRYEPGVSGYAARPSTI